MNYDKIINISDTARWVVDYKRKVVVCQSFHADVRYLSCKPSWHDMYTFPIETLKKVVDSI